MSRDDQTGANAPNRGTMIRQSVRGVAAFDVPAISSFPPPPFLTETQSQLWMAALSDVPLEFFRARHIPIMIQYVRSVERMMQYGDQFEGDPEDIVAMNKWVQMLGIVRALERQLSFHTTSLLARADRARGEMRVANQAKRAREAGASPRHARAGLIYVGH